MKWSGVLGAGTPTKSMGAGRAKSPCEWGSGERDSSDDPWFGAGGEGRLQALLVIDRRNGLLALDGFDAQKEPWLGGCNGGAQRPPCQDRPGTTGDILPSRLPDRWRTIGGFGAQPPHLNTTHLLLGWTLLQRLERFPLPSPSSAVLFHSRKRNLRHRRVMPHSRSHRVVRRKKIQTGKVESLDIAPQTSGPIKKADYSKLGLRQSMHFCALETYARINAPAREYPTSRSSHT